MADDKRIHELIRLVYECSAEPRHWPEFLSGYAASIGAHASGLMVQDLRNQSGNVSESVGFDPMWNQRYAEHYAGLNIWTQRASHLLWPGNVLASDRFIRDRELEKTEFYNDFLRPQDHYYSLGASITREDSVMSAITALRSKALGPFEEDEIDILRQLLPHLQSALRLYHHIAGLETRLDHATAALDQIPRGVLIADASGRILFMNRRAEAILHANQGLTLGVEGLKADRRGETARLRELIARAANTVTGNGAHPGGTVSITRPVGGGALTVQVAPLALGPASKRGPAVVLFVASADQAADATPGSLKEMLRLTSSEARLTAALVSGSTVKEFAEAAGVSLNTARTHLKSVFAKTGVSRQSELIRLAITLSGNR